MGSSDDSDSGDSSAGSAGSARDSSGSSERHRKRERKKRKREKHAHKADRHGHQQKDKSKSRRKHHKKHRSREKKPVGERSIITGKRIKRSDGASADAAGEARRQAVLAAMNEGEDESILPKLSTSNDDTRTMMRPDPTAMLELMRKSDAAQREKRQRLASLVQSGAGGDAYSTNSFTRDSGSQPRNYKRERVLRETKDL